MKKSSFFKSAVCLMLTVLLAAAPLCMGVSAASDFTSRSDFFWGINGHNQTYKSYPIRSLEQQIQLAAELGVKVYRFNFNPKNGADYAYLDKVVDWTQRYGMELLLVMDDFDPSADVLRSRFETVANRYNGANGHGLIRYIQVFNEVDVWAMTTEDFADSDNRLSGDGTVASHYSKMALAEVLPKFKAGVAGVKAGNPNCKTIVNISYLHTYLFDYLQENGVVWDLTGLDWYANMQNGSFEHILERLSTRYSQDILICETNIWPFTESMESDYENDTTFLPNAMQEVYNNYPRVKGMIFYELLDEPQYEMTAGRYEGESHFGFIKVNQSDFSIGAKKPIYHRVQRLLGGGPRQPGDSLYASSTAPTTTTTSRSASSRTATASTTSSHAFSGASTQVNTTSSNPSTAASSSSAPTESSVTAAVLPSVNTNAPTKQPTENTEIAGSFPVAAIVAICIAAFLIIAIIVFLILKIKFGLFPGFLDGLTKH